MSVIKFIHSTIKTLSLAFLSITHTFNYLNYISFMLIIIRDEEKKNISTNLYIILFFIIYDISKFFTNSITLRINRFIGDYAYYSISICILSVINLIFSFISFSYSNIYIFIFYRIFISLFNNISQYIDLPLSLLYNRREFYYKKRNFSFFQKINIFFFYLFFLFFFKLLKNFYVFCFLLSILNLICFIFSLIIIGCNRENIYKQYYPNTSEKDKYSRNLIQQSKLRQNNNINIISEENKNNKNNLNKSDQNEIMGNINIDNNNSNNVNLNINTSINNTDNLMKTKAQANADINNNKININHNKIKIEEQNEIRNFNPSQTLRGLLFPFLFSDNNINQNLYSGKIKIIIKLLFLFTTSKCLYFISLFMLIFKIDKIKITSFIDKNNNELLFSKFSLSLKLTSITEEYIFLFMSYYFLNIILYFINMSYTSIALKKVFVNYFFYYLSLLVFLVSSIFFIYYYLKSGDNTLYALEKIRKDIILCFLLNFIMNECNMIMSIFYNIFGKKKGFGERMLKDIKSYSVFFAGILFLLIQSFVVLTNIKNKELIFEKYFYYAVFFFFGLIIFLLSIFI